MTALGLSGSGGRRWCCDTVRRKLLKVAVRIRISHRRIWLSLPSAYPFKAALAGVLARLDRLPDHHPSPG